MKYFVKIFFLRRPRPRPRGLYFAPRVAPRTNALRAGAKSKNIQITAVHQELCCPVYFPKFLMATCLCQQL